MYSYSFIIAKIKVFCNNFYMFLKEKYEVLIFVFVDISRQFCQERDKSTSSEVSHCKKQKGMSLDWSVD